MSRIRGRTIPLRSERHGYGVMQCVEELTKGRIMLGAGTIYTSLGKLEADRRAPGGYVRTRWLGRRRTAVGRTDRGVPLGRNRACGRGRGWARACLLYTSDAADDLL